MRVFSEGGQVDVSGLKVALSEEFDSVKVPPKAPVETLFGGTISASVTLANATEIDMRGHTKLGLEIASYSGTGTWVFYLWSCSTSGGTYVPVVDAAGADGHQVTIQITTAASIPVVENLYQPYYKLVPALTGTSSLTANITKGV